MSVLGPYMSNLATGNRYMKYMDSEKICDFAYMMLRKVPHFEISLYMHHSHENIRARYGLWKYFKHYPFIQISISCKFR